jgi:hypothetical protein
MASLEATGCRHRASIAANSSNWSCIPRYFDVSHHQNSGKRLLVDANAPVFNRDMTYESDRKDLTKVSICAPLGARAYP